MCVLLFRIFRCSVGNYSQTKELQFKWFNPNLGQSLTWQNRPVLLSEAVAASIYSLIGLAFEDIISDNTAN